MSDVMCVFIIFIAIMATISKIYLLARRYVFSSLYSSLRTYLINTPLPLGRPPFITRSSVVEWSGSIWRLISLNIDRPDRPHCWCYIKSSVGKVLVDGNLTPLNFELISSCTSSMSSSTTVERCYNSNSFF